MKNLFILLVIALTACSEPSSDFKIADPVPVKETATPAKEETVTPLPKEEPKPVEPAKQTKPKATTSGALRKPLSEK
jgi:outer membrane biosynthesis protein TonB